MATAQDKWYSWNAAKRPRTQEQKPCEIGSLALSQASATDHRCAGVSLTLRREIDSGKLAGFNESFRIHLTNDEIDRIVKWRDHCIATYGKAETQ
jgi:hypothetical protein